MTCLVSALDGLATVDDEGVADSECGVAGAEPEDRCCYLLDVAESADRFLRDERVTSVGPVIDEASDHLGVDDAGADGVDADVRCGVVQGGALGESDDAELRGTVRGSSSKSPYASAGGRVDDRTTSVVEHERDLVLHTQEDTPQVGGDDAFPFRFRDVGDARVALFDSGVVEGDVDPAERVDRTLQGCADLVAAGDVAADGHHVPADLFDGLNGVTAVFLGQVGRDDAGAFTCERDSRRAADAIAGAGDEDDLPSEASVAIRAHGVLLI